MKKILISIISLFIFISYAVSQRSYTACYVCNDNTYIKYTGEDSKEKRQLAKNKFNCHVIGRIPECTNCKGTL